MGIDGNGELMKIYYIADPYIRYGIEWPLHYPFQMRFLYSEAAVVHPWYTKYIVQEASPDNYQPLHAIIPPKPQHHPVIDIQFIYLAKGLVLSQKAVDSLQNFIVGNGRLLPIDVHSKEKYFVFHVKNVLDALDYDKCYGLRKERSGIDVSRFIVRDIPIYAFQEEVVQEAHVFTIPERKNMVFISSKVREHIVASDLRCGVDFIGLWDSENPDFPDESYASAEEWLALRDKLKEQSQNKYTRFG